jgi:DNA-directed RNA polymerase subunit K/omega
MTSYERSRLVAYRASQIERNAPLLIEPAPGVSCPIALALAECEAGVFSPTLRRLGFGKSRASLLISTAKSQGA